jgi:hypothetical protein
MEASTSTDNSENKQKIEKQKKLVADLFSTLNLVFTQTKLGVEKSDLLLRAIHQYKTDILKIDPYWKLVSWPHITIGRIFCSLDAIVIEDEWDSNTNKFLFNEIKDAMRKLRSFNSYWQLTEEDAITYTGQVSAGDKPRGYRDTLEELERLIIVV